MKYQGHGFLLYHLMSLFIHLVAYYLGLFIIDLYIINLVYMLFIYNL